MSDTTQRNQKSIDGIRRPGKRQRPANTRRRPTLPDATPDHELASDKSVDSLEADIEQSLDALINDEGSQRRDNDSDKSMRTGKRHSHKTAGKNRKKWSRKKKVIITIVIIILLAIATIVAYGFIALSKVSTIFSGNPIDILTPARLKEDDYGRSNILVFGTSEDDEGHSGAQLADSIMVLSVDQDTSDVAMFSIPRDLWVDYGMACSVGYSGKINATYLCGLESTGNDQGAASQQFATTVGRLLNMDISYYIKVDYGAISGVTDALGGIDVDIYSADERGIYDVQTGLNLPAGINHLNGEQALLLARARNSKGGYGLPRSNFDREKNQQRIVQALQKKAFSLGVLANPQQALSILDSLSDNIKTNVTMSELRQALDIALQMGDQNIRDIDISDLLTTGRIDSASAVIPTAGQGNFAELQSYLRQRLDESNSNGGEQ